MKIYKTKWYITERTGAARFVIVGNKSFRTMTEAESYIQGRSEVFAAGRMVTTIQGTWILMYPERYGVIENREEFLTVDDIRTKAIELAQHLAADGGSGYQVAEIPQLSDSALYYWLAGWGCEWNGQEWLNPEDPE